MVWELVEEESTFEEVEKVLDVGKVKVRYSGSSPQEAFLEVKQGEVTITTRLEIENENIVLPDGRRLRLRPKVLP